ncbi:MAG: hypothetical protein V4641_05350 [Pseudomonadota bacterium]|jgi:hypothetical protein
MKKITAGGLAFLTAPLVSAVISVVLTPAARTISVYSTLNFIGLFYFISAAVTLLFAVPTFFLLLRIRSVNSRTTLAAGTVIGAAVGAVMHLPNLAHIADIAITGGIGAVSSICFWLIWKQGKEQQHQQ